jgi:hypothetical protein
MRDSRPQCPFSCRLLAGRVGYPFQLPRRVPFGLLLLAGS